MTLTVMSHSGGKSADALATHLRCSREAAVSAAIADQMVKLGLAG
jgi:hypothetical protein